MTNGPFVRKNELRLYVFLRRMMKFDVFNRKNFLYILIRAKFTLSAIGIIQCMFDIILFFSGIKSLNAIDSELCFLN